MYTVHSCKHACSTRPLTAVCYLLHVALCEQRGAACRRRQVAPSRRDVPAPLTVVGSLPTKRIKYVANLEHEYIQNYKLLQNSFKKLSVDKVRRRLRRVATALACRRRHGAHMPAPPRRPHACAACPLAFFVPVAPADTNPPRPCGGLVAAVEESGRQGDALTPSPPHAAVLTNVSCFVSGSIHLKRIKFNTNLEHEGIINYKVLQSAFTKLGVDKVSIPVSEHAGDHRHAGDRRLPATLTSVPAFT